MTSSTHSVYVCWYRLEYKLHAQLQHIANQATNLLTETVIEISFVAGTEGGADDLVLDKPALELFAVLCDYLRPSVDSQSSS